MKDRTEKYLESILGYGDKPDIPQSRFEYICESIINNEDYDKDPQSRGEYLMLQIGDMIKSGGGDAPSGTLDITENGEYNVSKYAKVDVEVQIQNSMFIKDASYFFAENRRIDEFDNLYPLFNTSNVTNMASMFYNCSKLNELDLSSFNTSNVTNMASMFYNCNLLKKITLGNKDSYYYNSLSNNNIFYKCDSLNILIINGKNIMRSSATNTLNGIPSSCKIYVPDDLVDTYKTATNWSSKASQIYPLSEYVEE